MTTDSKPNTVRLPLVRTGSIALISCVVIAFIGGLISKQRDGQLSDGLATLLATIPGAVTPLLILRSMPNKEPSAWGVPVLAGTVIRALIVITVGMAVYVLIGPSKIVFFLTLLGALMTMLVIDVVGVLSLIQKHPMGTEPLGDAEGVS